MKRTGVAVVLAVVIVTSGEFVEAGFIVNSTSAYYDSNWDNPGANDHVTFGASSVDVSVPLNTTVTAVLESGLFQNNYSFIPDQDFSFSITQTISIGAYSTLLTIPGMIRITGPGDTLFTYDSAPVSIDLANGTILTIAAKGVTVPLYLGDAPFSVLADFTLSASPATDPSVALSTPAPSSLILLSTLAGSACGIGRVRRRLKSLFSQR